jgi:hypothetical protein
MRPELLERLKEIDSHGHWESPIDFDYFRALGEVVHHKSCIEHHLGSRLALDHQVQDASFFCELHQLDQRYLDDKGCGAIVQTIGIRFSAFDRMFTILGTEAEQFHDRIPAVIEYLTKQNYRYVSLVELSASYDGKETCGTDQWTWFTRFFDYL